MVERIWLLDEIAIIQPYNKAVAAEEFQVWKLAVRPDQTATLTVRRWQRQHRVPPSRSSHTDFPLDELTLVLCQQSNPLAGASTDQRYARRWRSRWRGLF